MTGRLLQVKEVADMLAISPSTVLRWSRDEKLPAPFKLPSGQLRYPEGEILSRLASWRERPALVSVPEEGS